MKALSALLLKIHSASHELFMDEFQEKAISLLCEAIPFDHAWWGMAAWDGRQFHLHSSYHHNLPDDFDEIWEAYKHEDTLALATERHPGIAIVFDKDKLHSIKGMGDVAKRFGVDQAMAVINVNPTTNLITFLSLYRVQGRARFTEHDRELFESVMPNLTMALNINRIAGLGHLRTNQSKSRFAMGIADKKGILHNAEPGFATQMLCTWPGWQGPALPEPLVTAIQRKEGKYTGQRLAVQISAVGDLYFLTVKERSNVERLSRRELEIAEAFANGGSYKEIARALSLSPATVRHHLRTIYLKLDVANKASMAKALHFARD